MVKCNQLLPSSASCKENLVNGKCKIHGFKGVLKECIVKIREDEGEVYRVLKGTTFYTSEQILEMAANALPSEASLNLKALFPNLKIIKKTGKSISSGFFGGKANQIDLPEATKLIFEKCNCDVFLKIGVVKEDDNSTFNELLIYKFVDEYIVEPGRSPNFVKFLMGYYTRASNIGPGIWEDVAKQTSTSLKDDSIVTVTITEKSKGRTLHDELSEDAKGRMSNSEFAKKYTSIIFQVLYSLREMFAFGMKHNDLILSNVFIEPDGDLVYEVAPGKFYQTRGWIAKIYDFDLSSFNSGNPTNTKIHGTFCVDTGVCHNYNDKFDLYLFLWGIWMSVKSTRRSFSQLLSKTFILDPQWKFLTKGSPKKYDLPFRLPGRICGKVSMEGGWYCVPNFQVPDDEVMSFTNALELTDFFEELRIEPNQIKGRVWRSIFAEK